MIPAAFPNAIAATAAITTPIAVPRIADTVLLEYPPRSPNVTIVVNTATMIVNTIGEIPRYIIGNIIPIIHANAKTRLKIA